MSGLRSLSLLVAMLCATTVFAITPAKLTLLDLDKYPWARCLDGTAAGYYFRPSSDPRGTDKWIISLEGGGECVEKGPCQRRAQTVFGSSKDWAPERNLAGIQSDTALNPNFGLFNQIFVPYCSGDLFVGSDTELSSRAFGLQFSGHHVIASVIGHALAARGLDSATHIIVSGVSAGGIGAVAQVDRIREQIAAAVAKTHPTRPRVRHAHAHGPVRVYTVPIAGSYFSNDAVYTAPSPAPIDFIPWAYDDLKQYYRLWNATVPTVCSVENPDRPWVCIFSSASYETLQTPVFAVQAQTDKVVVSLHAGVPSVWDDTSQDPRPCKNTQDPCPAPVLGFLRGWTREMRAALRPVVERKYGRNDGVFFPSCLLHGEFAAGAPKIGGKNYLDAAWAWFEADTEGEHVHMDTCEGKDDIFCGQCSR